MSPPFRRVLVANRGEIALRVIRACHELGIEAVAVYSDADAGAAHVRAADDAVRLGPAPATESYLLIEAIVRAARETGAEAIHPGYGFLAERAAFARAVEAAGIIFVGPSPEAIAMLGDKLAARRAATAAGVPVVPGTLEPASIDTPAAVARLGRAATTVGFPLLVKATAGGGGRGMRRVGEFAALPDALTTASREAAAAFGDGSVYLEREVRPARHVEVQLLGDAGGTVIALGERDCSIQRRHQKLVEEAPAPGLAAAVRAELHELGIRVARAARLRGAATAEFLLDRDGQFWFLEVNARLQVEHGITELVTGVDLVAEQLKIAAGQPISPAALRAAAQATEPPGYAIEVRLSAEDPARDFMPVPGRVGRWSMPSGPGIRVDTAIEAGDRVPPEYDPLVAKLMAYGSDRLGAAARLRSALDEVEVTGIQTTLPFHRYVCRHPSFLAGELSTDWVDEHWDGVGERVAAVRLAQLAAGLGELTYRGGLAELAAAGGPGPASGDGEVRTSRSAWSSAGRVTAADRWPR